MSGVSLHYEMEVSQTCILPNAMIHFGSFTALNRLNTKWLNGTRMSVDKYNIFLGIQTQCFQWKNEKSKRCVIDTNSYPSAAIQKFDKFVLVRVNH